MAVDLSTDLTITLLAGAIETPTITGVYDSGSPAGTYLPGRDFALTDDVSKGLTAKLNFSMAFDSLSNQLYGLDRVYIQSVDDPKTDGTGNVPGRWINQVPDSLDTVDDGLNTVIPNYNAQMSSIVFDETADIQSDSTVATAITLTLPIPNFWWKSKLMPKIQVVAVKDGIQKVSAPLQLPTIRLAPQASYISNMTTNGSISYSPNVGTKGFFIPLALSSFKGPLPGITGLWDPADYDLITYEVDYAVKVNGVNMPLTAANFTPTVLNGQLVSLTYTAGVLRVVMRQINPGDALASFQVFVPFDAGSAQSATVTADGTWHVDPPVITDFINRVLFVESAIGAIHLNVVVDASGVPPQDQIRLQNTISANLAGKTVTQGLVIENYPCVRTPGSVILRMVDSEIAAFGPTVTPNFFYTKTDGQAGGGSLAPSDYLALYAHYDFPAAYDPNQVAMLVYAGVIPLMSYADVIASGKKPNMMAVTLLTDLLVGVDAAKPMIFNFNGDLDVLTQAEFAALYQQDPKTSYPSHFYNVVNLGTCYASLAEANAAVGTLLSTVDSLMFRGTGVFLDLGSTAIGQPASILRFHTFSTVRTDLPLGAITADIDYGVVANSSSGLLSSITDYTKEYCLIVRWGSQASANIPAGTVITVNIPDILRPYLYLSGTQPYVQVQNGGPVTPITQYHLNGSLLALTAPRELNMQPDQICVPVKLLTPSADVTSSFQSLTFSDPLVYKQDPTSLLYGFTTDSLLFQVITQTQPFTLVGARIDTTGLMVNPTVYAPGQAVTYTATVYNTSYPTSDYCMSMTVPTNQYNPVEGSNNALPAFITAINPTDARTVVYFQTAANATAADIAMMKLINRPGGSTLHQYFDMVIVNTWTRYSGQALPAGVVMLAACTDGVAQNTQVRVDYDVEVQVPQGNQTLYTNNAVFNYDSSGANLEAQSNMVTIRTRQPSPVPVPIVKAPVTQLKPKMNGTPVNFTLTFDAPGSRELYTSFTVTDALHPALAPVLADITVTAGVLPIAVAPAYDPATNAVSITFPNTIVTAGTTITVLLPTTVADVTKLPASNVIHNTARLSLNNTPTHYKDSNTVEVRFFRSMPPGRCQAVTDLIQSVALEQAALAQILNAEGENLQRAVALPLTVSETLTFNRSAIGLVESVSLLESVLKRKLDLFSACGVCGPCVNGEPDT